jgi:cytochrome P450
MPERAAEQNLKAAELFGRIFSAAGKIDPYPVYAGLHECGEAVTLPGDMVAAVSFDAANEVLRDPAYRVMDAARFDEVWPQWREHPSLLQHSLLTTNDPAHARMRALMAGTFTPRRVAQLTATVEQVADSLIGRMAELGAAGEVVDFMAEFAYPLPVTVICELLGVPESDRLEFRPVARRLARGIDFGDDPNLMSDADDAARWLGDYFAKLAGARRAAPREDLISALVQATGEDGSLTEEELLINLTLLLFAGFETTTNLLGNGLQILMTMPDADASLRARQVSADAFVTEVLRFDSPVQAGTDRWRPEAGQLRGVDVPAGAQVIALLGAANRDPRRFADPGAFNPARPDLGALSFGAGPHYCLGAALARMEGTVAFPRLLGAFGQISAAGEPVRRSGVALRGFDKLPVALA